jgi:hypothetical protein
MGRILKSYFFWTYERGSFHYDVMVTLILAFIFVTPHLWKYRDKPEERQLTARDVLVRMSGDSFIYQIDADQVKAAVTPDMTGALRETIAPVSGAVAVDRYETIKDASGKVSAYKVWAHRN